MSHLLAHLSRIGKIIVYEGIRRPSVRPSSVRRLSTFSNDISSEAVNISHIASIGRGNKKMCFLADFFPNNRILVAMATYTSH